MATSGPHPESVVSLVSMADSPRLHPQLAEVVAEVRERARSTGELDPPNLGSFRSELTPGDREAVGRWVRDGGYRDAVAVIVDEDPDLADQ